MLYKLQGEVRKSFLFHCPAESPILNRVLQLSTCDSSFWFATELKLSTSLPIYNGLDSHTELSTLVLHHSKRAFQQHCRLRQNHSTIKLDYSNFFCFTSYFASFPFLPQYLFLQSQGRECHIKVHFQHLYKALLSGIGEKHKMWHKPFLKTTCSSQVDRPNAICASVLKE